MKDSKYGVLVAHVCLYLILTLVAIGLSAAMSECKPARAETQFEKVWFTDEKRESLSIGFSHKHFLFSLGLEYTDYGEADGVSHEAFGASSSFSVFTDWDACNWTFRLGGGAGFLLELDWKSIEYDIFGNVIDYPDIEAETYFYLHGYGSLSFDVVIISIGLRGNDKWLQPSFSIGVEW